MVLADIEGIETFRLDWRVWADRLGIGSGPAITVLGDGAEWIWNAADAQFPQCRQVLDIYHALEYLSDATKALYREGSAEAQASYAAAEHALVGGGWSGVCRWVAQELASEDTDARRKAVEPLLSYLSKHVGRLNYLSQRAEGRSIGSGLIEGSIKTLGLRMKARGARWVERKAEKMTAVVGLSASTIWDRYWSLAASAALRNPVPHPCPAPRAPRRFALPPYSPAFTLFGLRHSTRFDREQRSITKN